MIWGWFNWGRVWEFNQVFGSIVQNDRYIRYLGIDTPARSRPDAHATGDCLRFTTRAGVMEGWTEYLWHYTVNEGDRFRSC
ncbi:hypothetical protein WG66_011222 [Moniliophthora roreri]|nr:hypothetical protein WG66_011222 [Moniliophthora roreri]